VPKNQFPLSFAQSRFRDVYSEMSLFFGQGGRFKEFFKEQLAIQFI